MSIRRKHATNAFRKWVLGYFRYAWKGTLFLFFIISLIVFFQLLEPWPLKALVDSVFGTTPLPQFLGSFKTTDQLIFLIAFSVVFIYGAETTLNFLKTHFTNWLGLHLDFRIASDYFDRIQHLSLSNLSNNSSDYIYRQNNEISGVSGLLIDIPAEFYGSILMVVSIAAIMMTIDPELSLIGFVILPLLYLSIHFFSRRIEKQSSLVEESNSKVYGYTSESIENVKLIQSFNKESFRLKGLQDMMNFNIRTKLRYSIMDGGFALTNDLLATVAMAVLVAVGSYKVVSGRLTVGDLLIFLTYLSEIYAPLQSVSQAFGNSKVNKTSAKRIQAVFKNTNLIQEAEHPMPLKRAKGHIEFRDVSFSYQRETILHHINLDIPAGQRVALIGHSGSGKSTLLSLLPRFYEFNGGSILIDGVDIRQIKLSDLRQQFAIVTQEAPVLATSILNNLAFAREAGMPTQSELLEAAKASNSYEFIKELPEGFRTEISERGNNLSGGQRQRLAIARAFLRDSPILLLDEPTSALDAESEGAVVDALSTLMANRTTLIVSHNSGTLLNADVIYVMRSGKLIYSVRKEDHEEFMKIVNSTKETAT